MRAGRYDRKSIEPPDERHELRDGHWQKQGLVSRWVSHECEDCGDIVPWGQRCDTCLTWATKNARDFEWARMSRANRVVVWTILDARHDKELTAA